MSEETPRPNPDKELSQGKPEPPKPETPKPPAASPTPSAAPRPAPTMTQKATAAAAVKSAPPKSPARRQFLINWLAVAWGAFAAATVVALSTTLRFLFPNVLFEPKMSFKIGKPGDYEVGIVDTRWKEKFGIWVVRTPEIAYVLSTVCTHLGCTPNWLDNEQKFKCPCHGSGFYKTGINFEGPAPRPLERFALSIADDGQLLVDKSIKFQYEKGEWTNPHSFVAF